MIKQTFSEEYYRLSEEALNIGLDTAPAYDSWRKFDPGRDFRVDDRYAALPALTKEDIRSHFPHGLVPLGQKVSDGLSRGEIEYVETSGTTSEKVTNLWDQEWWNASESASWKLNAHTSHLDHNHREAQLASALSVGFLSEEDLPMESRILNERFLFLNEKISVIEWKEHHLKRMVYELKKFKPAIIEANPSLLARLCWWAMDNNIAIYSPEVILFTYEFPSRLHLNAVKKIFNAPVISSYGTTETGYVFMECEYGILHQNTNFCRVDFEPLKKIHGGPDLGRILVTTFRNPWTSLIRFDVGDLVRIHDNKTCKCGRSEGYMLSAIEGRIANATVSTTGKLVSTKRVDDALSEIPGIRDYELIQTSQNEYSLKLLTVGSNNMSIKTARKALAGIYGIQSDINVEIYDEIKPSPSGKYRRTSADFKINTEDLLA